MIGSLQQLDEWLFRAINSMLANPLGDLIFPAFNQAAPFLPLFILALAWLAYRNSRRLWLATLGVVVAITFGDALIFNPLKHGVARPRPAASLEDVRALASGAAGGHSFPSSHTANAFVAAAVLSSFFPRRRWIFVAVASTIGLARIYVGVHYPSDVIGSALLGWFFGKLCFLGARAIRPKISRVFENLFRSEPNGALPMQTAPPLWAPILLLVGIQAARLAWAATTSLDAPPISLRLLFWAAEPPSATFYWLIWPAQGWFAMFGSSPLSLWAIPWTMQTLWLGILAWVARRAEEHRTLWGLAFLSACIPLVSQLSYFGSPDIILEDADWNAPRPIQTWLWYSIVGLPLWLAAMAQWRRHPICSLLTWGGWILASGFPSFPWHFAAWIASGTILILARDLGKLLASFSQDQWAKQRFALVLLAAYGLVLSMAVYNPRFLRKLDLSFLPRNNPQYVQTGWREWIERIHPQLAHSECTEIWTDHSTSQDQVQYLVGPRFRVRNLDGLPLPPIPPSTGAFYIREVYLAQIHPHVIFSERRDGILSNPRFHVEELSSTEIFRKGDPIRQLQLYKITQR